MVRAPTTAEVQRAHVILNPLGLELAETPDAAVTITAIPGMPGDRDGLQNGAVLLRIGSTRIRTLDDARSALMALEEHGEFSFEFAQPDWTTLHQVAFAPPPNGWSSPPDRQDKPEIALERVDGLIWARILRFQGGRTRAVLEAALKSAPAPLVIDLRHASGGSLREALAVAALLLPSGTPIGEMRPPTQGLAKLFAHDPAPLRDLPVTVVVDRDTASAAEILSSVLQQTGRATIIGERTSGKCIAEQVFPLPDRMTLEIPVSEFIPPGGPPCNLRGVDPTKVLEEGDLASGLESSSRLRKRSCLSLSGPVPGRRHGW